MGDQTIHMSDKLRKRKEWWRQQKGQRKRVRKKTLFNGSRYYRIKIFIYRFIYGFLSPQQTNCCHQNLRNGLLDSIRIIWLEDGCGENSVLGHENLQGVCSESPILISPSIFIGQSSLNWRQNPYLQYFSCFCFLGLVFY